MPSSRPGLRIGSVRGVSVYLTAGWAVISVVLVALFAPIVQSRLGLDLIPAAAIALMIPMLLAASIFAHELAHGLTAQRFGVPVREYVLSLWGGHTAFETEISRPGVSALVAGVGPLTNGALAGLFAAAAAVAEPGGAAQLVLGAVTFTNAFVAIFNALPALPMDGGRLLEALIWKVRGDRDLGTLVAGRVGQVVAVLVAMVPLGLPLLRGGRPTILTAIWALMIAAMLWQGASASVRLGRARRSARDVDLRAWARPAVAVPDSATLDALASVPPHATVIAVAPDGRPYGWVRPENLDQVPETARARTPVSAVATSLPASALTANLTGAEALSSVARAARDGAPLVILVQHGSLVGVVDVAEVGRRLQRRG